MVRQSFPSLMDLLSGSPAAGTSQHMTVMQSSFDGSETGKEAGHPRVIMAANFLPLVSTRDPETGKWSFVRDEDSLLLQMKDGFSPETEVIYVGCLKNVVDANEQDEVAQELHQKYQCFPVFLDPDTQEKFYLNFCKEQLWPLFHYMLPFLPNLHKFFERAPFQAYVAANIEFAKRIMLVMTSDYDYVWVHDYHLMLVPTFLRKQVNRVKLGFFLHSPFPSSEIYMTLPVRKEILRGLLNADLVGFHTFDYARHFLSCCNRMFGLDYHLKRGYIELDYYGRMITVKILPVGIHMPRLQSVLCFPDTVVKIKEIKDKYKGKKLILGVDDMDIFKGISQKLLGLELLMKECPHLRKQLVLVQIASPPRGMLKEVRNARDEITSIAERINTTYGGPDHHPVVFLDRPMQYYEKVAYYAAAECFIVNAVRDGMNLVPYEYIVCREGHKETDKDPTSLRTSTLIVSEFVGCSPSLSGAIRVNPWNIEEISEALASAMRLTLPEKELHHAKHYRYVSSHDVVYWVRSFIQDLERACKDNFNRTCWDVGFGLNSRVVALPLSFRRLCIERVVSSYRKSHKRVFFLDHDGTITPRSSINRAPSEELISILKDLCSDADNTVFIVSGRGQEQLDEWFSPIDALGIAAEHGYFLRWTRPSEWETGVAMGSFEWKEIVEPIMTSYTEATDGSSIESKKTALVWHHQEADPDFGSWQAKELLIQLENVLANEPVMVTRGHHIVEVKPQGTGKGLAVRKVLSTLASNGSPPDFILCIGDDRSDEDMFESIYDVASSPLLPSRPTVFPCTVGLKPSKAKFYVEETGGVTNLLRVLAAAPKQRPETPPEVRSMFI